jgi:hypothetical protein
MNRVRAIFWLVSLAAVFAASAPSIARAHAGHSHHAPGHHVSGHAHQTPAQPATSDAGRQDQTPASKTLADKAGKNIDAGISAANDPSPAPACNERGCCFASHCVSCTAFIAPDSGAAWPPASSFAYGRAIATAPAGVPSDRLRRPPKSRS